MTAIPDAADAGAAVVGAHNARIKRLRRLVRRSKVRSDERAFVVDGPILAADALVSPLEVERLYVGATGGRELLAPELERVGVAEPDVPVHLVDDDVLASVLDPAHPRPVAAVVAAPSHALGDIDPDLPILVAVELRDPGNLGTVMRTAEAAGLGGIVVAGQSVDHLNPKTVRASAGSILRLPVVAFPSITEAIDAIRVTGRTVVAAVVDPAAPPYDLCDLRAAAICVGNEPHGLDHELTSAVDVAATIPMAAEVESLNVGAAAAVLAFEAARQRRKRPPSVPTGRPTTQSEKLSVKQPQVG